MDGDINKNKVQTQEQKIENSVLDSLRTEQNNY